MKRQLSILALMAALLGGGALTAHAFLDPPGDCADPPAGRMAPSGKHFARMAEVLKLSDAQKEQVQSVLTAEQERVAPLREKLAENRKALRQAAEAETFDEAAVQSLAATRASLEAEMLVAHARARNQIRTILTSEQRELAEKLKPSRHERRGHRHLEWDDEE
jgi:Spy/CpxP family protein refolding chaperone